jgi:hypothetical protein
MLTYPSQRAVYNVFQREGYSTGHDRWPETNFAESPADVEVGGTLMYQEILSVSGFEENNSRAGRDISLNGDMQMAASNVSITQTISAPPHSFIHNASYSSQTRSVPQDERMVEENATISDSLEPAGLPEEVTLIQFVQEERLNGSHSFDTLLPEYFTINQTPEDKRRNVPHTPEQEQFIQNLHKFGYIGKPQYSPQHSLQHSGGRTKPPPNWARDGPGRSSEFPKLRKLRSFFDIKHSASKARANQASPFADDDSGYYSGRGTPSTRYWRDSLMSQVESPTRWNRHYSIDCHTLHEPKFPDEYRGVPPCSACGFSNIHNLGWVGNDLSLPEFVDELRSDFYTFKAIVHIDAAGNSALHYAAASGASFAVLNALIDAGVPPYQLNTANQNFFHCLTPCKVGFDDWNLDGAKNNLIKLLGRLDAKIKGQQDNDGQTVLHALASHITEPVLREETFK